MGAFEVRLDLFGSDKLDYRFCSPGWRRTSRAAPLDELVRRIEAIDPRECHRLLLAGGSPLTHPDFDALVERCRALGLSQLALETDGAALARPGVAQSLADRGFEKLFLVAGGVRRKVYEAAMQDPGTFVAAMEGIRAALASPLEVYLVVPVVRWTADDLEPLLDWTLALGAKPRGFLLSLPDVSKVPASARSALLPYAAQASLAARVFRACQVNRVEFGFATRRGVVPCASGGALDKYGTVFHDRFGFLKRAGESDDALVRVAACESCSLSKTCAGVEQAYVATFGEAEFAPVPLEVSMEWKLRPLNRLEARDFKNVSAFENEAAEKGRSLVRINGHCNMSCAFCFVDRTVPDFDEAVLVEEIEGLARHQTRHLVLSGGEPTLHPALPRLLKRAREIGFTTIEIQSNGVKATNMDYARDLVASGLNKITVSLHSVDPEHSDKITQLPKAFGKTIHAMHNFRALGVLTQVAHVITASNYKELPTTVRYLREEFPAEGGHLSVCFAIAQGISDLVYGWVMPTFTEIRPYFREALDYCLDTGVGFGGMIGQGGYPPCMLDGEIKYYERNLGNIFHTGDHSSQFYKAERCRECSFDPYCVGVRRSYVECYGDAEITPFRADIHGAVPIAPAPAGRDAASDAVTAGLVQLRRRRAEDTGVEG